MAMRMRHSTFAGHIHWKSSADRARFIWNSFVYQRCEMKAPSTTFSLRNAENVVRSARNTKIARAIQIAIKRRHWALISFAIFFHLIPSTLLSPSRIAFAVCVCVWTRCVVGLAGLWALASSHSLYFGRNLLKVADSRRIQIKHQPPSDAIFEYFKQI